MAARQCHCGFYELCTYRALQTVGWGWGWPLIFSHSDFDLLSPYTRLSTCSGMWFNQFFDLAMIMPNVGSNILLCIEIYEYLSMQATTCFELRGKEDNGGFPRHRYWYKGTQFLVETRPLRCLGTKIHVFINGKRNFAGPNFLTHSYCALTDP